MIAHWDQHHKPRTRGQPLRLDRPLWRTHHALGGGAKHAHHAHRPPQFIGPAFRAAGDGTNAVPNKVSTHISSHMTVVAFIIWPCVPSDSRGKEDPNATEEGGKEEEGEKGEEGEAKEEEEEEGEARRW